MSTFIPHLKIYTPSLFRDISVVGRRIDQVLVLLSDYMTRRFLVNITEGPIFRFESLEVFLYSHFDNIPGVFTQMRPEKKMIRNICISF